MWVLKVVLNVYSFTKQEQCLNTSFKQGCVSGSNSQIFYSIGLLRENYIKDVMLRIQTISKFINNHRIVYKAEKYVY